MSVALPTTVTAPDGPPPLLEVRDLRTNFPVKGGVLNLPVATCKAVDGVSFSLAAGRTLGLVGESGCGKSTLGKTIVRLHKPVSGQVLFEGTDLVPLSRHRLRPLRRRLQMVFQDPAESLNARHSVGEILAEPYAIQSLGTAAERRQWVRELLDRVGLPSTAADRFPFEFSGGQRQRIGIARSLALRPNLIVCDEPVSALDVSIQSQILNLLLDLQRDFHLAYLFIAHDLAVVKHVSDDIAVMYLGKIVEIAPADELYQKPRHPYTQALISAIPTHEPGAKTQRQVLQGDLPSPIHPPSGCAFHTRCPFAKDICRQQAPTLRVPPGSLPTHQVACHFDFPSTTTNTSATH